MKALILNATLASTLMAAAAIAQTTAPTDRSPAPAPSDRPATTAPAAPGQMAPSNNNAAPRATAPSTQSGNTASTAPAGTNMAGMDHRASKLIGSAVYNQANERIGDINELLLDNSGKVSRVVIGVGGFLGMGEHEVAVPFTDLKMMQDGSTLKVTSNFTKQSLQSMPRWTWDNTAPARR